MVTGSTTGMSYPPSTLPMYNVEAIDDVEAGGDAKTFDVNDSTANKSAHNVSLHEQNLQIK